MSGSSILKSLAKLNVSQQIERDAKLAAKFAAQDEIERSDAAFARELDAEWEGKKHARKPASDAKRAEEFAAKFYREVKDGKLAAKMAADWAVAEWMDNPASWGGAVASDAEIARQLSAEFAAEESAASHSQGSTKLEYHNDFAFFNCPHCGSKIVVKIDEINCKIFRHAVDKKTGLGVSPHLSQNECEKLIAAGSAYGCVGPFRIDSGVAVVCGYI